LCGSVVEKRVCLFAGVSEASRCGYAVLTGGGSALSAVEAAVICMENNPIFNAGKQLYTLWFIFVS